MKRVGLRLMLRTICAEAQSPMIEMNNTSHLTRQAAISPAVTIVQKPSDVDLFSISTAMSSPKKVKNIDTPMVNANADRPKDGS